MKSSNTKLFLKQNMAVGSIWGMQADVVSAEPRSGIWAFGAVSTADPDGHLNGR